MFKTSLAKRMACARYKKKNRNMLNSYSRNYYNENKKIISERRKIRYKLKKDTLYTLTLLNELPFSDI